MKVGHVNRDKNVNLHETCTCVTNDDCCWKNTNKTMISFAVLSNFKIIFKCIGGKKFKNATVSILDKNWNMHNEKQLP